MIEERLDNGIRAEQARAMLLKLSMSTGWLSGRVRNAWRGPDTSLSERISLSRFVTLLNIEIVPPRTRSKENTFYENTFQSPSRH